MTPPALMDALQCYVPKSQASREAPRVTCHLRVCNLSLACWSLFLPSDHVSRSSFLQMDYIEFVCRPLLTALCDLMPEMRDLRQAVARNYSFWLSMVVEDGR